MLQKSFCLVLFLSLLCLSVFAKSHEELTAEADSLKALGEELLKKAEYDQALSIFTQELKIRQQVADTVSIAENYNNIGKAYFNKCEYDQALEYFNKAVEISLKLLKPGQIDVGRYYHNIGAVFHTKGEYDQALEFFRKALNCRLKTSDSYIQDVASSYNNIGAVYGAKEEYDQALEYHKKALDILIKAFGPNHPDVTVNYNNIASIYSDKGDYERALEYYEKALKVRLKVFGPEHPDVANSYSYIGIVHSQKGDYDCALEYFEKALKVRLKVFGPEHPDVALSYLNIGTFYYDIGDYDQALEYYKKSLEVWLKIFGPKHYNVAKSYHNIGTAYLGKGDYDCALEYYKKALEIWLWVVNPDHTSVAAGYNCIGIIYSDKGDYDQALEYYNKALEIRLKVLGHDHPDVGKVYGGIGVVYSGKGDYDKALIYFKKVLEVLLKVYGHDHPDVARTHNNIGYAYLDKKDYDKAIEFFDKSLKIWFKVRPDHPDVSSVYGGIGVAYSGKGNYTQALEYHNKALENSLKSLGSTHPYVAETYKHICDVYQQKGNYDKALEYIDCGIISMKIDTITGSSIDSLSAIDLRPLPLTVKLLHNKAKTLLSLKSDKEGIKKALAFLSLANELVTRFREELVTGTAKFQWADEFHEINQLAINLLFQLETKGQEAKYEKEAFLWSERGRARLFLEQLSVSRIPFSGIIPDELYLEEENYRNEILRIDREIEQETEKSKEDRQQAVIRELYSKRFAYEDSLKQWVEHVEKTYPIYTHFRYPRPSNLEEIQNVLKHDESLVSYSLLEDKTIAWVVRLDTFFMVELPISDSIITSDVDALRWDLLKMGGTYKNRTSQLYEYVFKPLEEYLETNQVVYIIPDGALQLLPFELLWDEEKGEYLLNRYKITYIQSGSTLALLRKIMRKDASKERLIAFGDPVYKQTKLEDESIEVASDVNETDRLRSAYAERGFGFKRLPMSGEEVLSISEVLGVKPLKPPNINLRLDANEKAVKSFNLSDYQYLHFACHGYLGNVESEIMQPSLVLSLVGNKEEDGFLQMSEVFNLKLNADLVVLSACETGMGELVRGEGIIGLTRAFMYAGTPSIVVSLWRVSDYSTSCLMRYFYRNLGDGMNKAEALRQAKIELIEKDGYIHPLFWAPFILVGEWR